MIQAIAASIIVAILIVGYLIRRDDAAHRDARKRNPRPMYPFGDDPWGSL